MGWEHCPTKPFLCFSNLPAARVLYSTVELSNPSGIASWKTKPTCSAVSSAHHQQYIAYFDMTAWASFHTIRTIPFVWKSFCNQIWKHMSGTCCQNPSKKHKASFPCLGVLRGNWDHRKQLKSIQPDRVCPIAIYSQREDFNHGWRARITPVCL